ncbi:MAG: hypothetical protein V7629_18305 [Motiliproteus sp.]
MVKRVSHPYIRPWREGAKRKGDGGIKKYSLRPLFLDYRALHGAERRALPVYKKQLHAYFATPLDRAETLINGNLLGLDEVEWSTLSWRAVIPLHTRNYSTEAIADKVNFPTDIGAGIDSAHSLIAYYASLLERLQQGEAENPEPPVHGNPEAWDITPAEIVRQLCEGVFDPAAHNHFVGKALWQHPHFALPATEAGLEPKPNPDDITNMKIL